MVSVVTVSIGRCVGDVPMPDGRWSAFQDAVRFALSGCESTVFVDGASSVGRWCDEATGSEVSEDSATWVAECGRPELLAELLAVLAGQYGQDAIALTVGETTLCRPTMVTR